MKKIEQFDFGKVRTRLIHARETSGLSARKVSLDSGNGAGYFHSITVENKEPSVSKLADLCTALGVSLSYILYGLEITPETEKIIQQLEENPNKRDGILSILDA